LTIPKLKKLLPEDCFEAICENEFYSNTYTTIVKVTEALNYLSLEHNINDRIPVRQETYSYEDYNGFN